MNFTQQSVLRTCIVFLLGLVLCGCASQQTTFRHAVPVFPADAGSTRAMDVDSTQPTFRWLDTDPELQGTNYDFALWEAIITASPTMGQMLRRGDLIYAKEKIAAREFTIDKPLIPGRYYFWSVKRSGNDEWARVIYESSKDSLFPFKSETRHAGRLFSFRISTSR